MFKTSCRCLIQLTLFFHHMYILPIPGGSTSKKSWKKLTSCSPSANSIWLRRLALESGRRTVSGYLDGKNGAYEIGFTRTLEGRLELLKARGQSLGLPQDAFAARESRRE